MNRFSRVQPCDDSCVSPILAIEYDKLKKEMNHEGPRSVNIIGVVDFVGERQVVEVGWSLKATRQVVLVDPTMDLTSMDAYDYGRAVFFWQEQTNFDMQIGDVVAIIGAYQRGPWLPCSVSNRAFVAVNPTWAGERVASLHRWWQHSSFSYSNLSLMGEASRRPHIEVYHRYDKLPITLQMAVFNKVDLTLQETPIHRYSPCTVVIQQVNHTTWCYSSCPECHKKLVETDGQGPAEFCCTVCNTVYSAVPYRYVVQLLLSDHTGSQWATAFGQDVENLLGIDANSLYELKARDPERFEQYWKDLCYMQVKGVLRRSSSGSFTFGLIRHTRTKTRQDFVDLLSEIYKHVPWPSASAPR
eukprot:gnl/Spiro4/3300_TR1609_c0_g1_i1.p1 gnl/Spiro4/3300_TR1609_c0_g1~~gnl/Spiro4/3300_TR1609_c0_g1_i1.p1  ORF type:complete len:357 (+),score=20.72 gnl/Spiro4/3300_TR1609_c0_g1_i1:252-1322(+)